MDSAFAFGESGGICTREETSSSTCTVGLHHDGAVGFKDVATRSEQPQTSA